MNELDFVYAVVYSNYDPSEIAAIYRNEADAQADADDREGPWAVEKWRVRTKYERNSVSESMSTDEPPSASHE